MSCVRNSGGHQTRHVASYSTDFATNENPLSQGGRWLRRDPNQTNCQSTNGAAFGTNTGSPGVFDDSHANMPGFGDSYEITGRIFLGGLTNQRFQEVELLCLWCDNYSSVSTAFGNSTSNGYEWNVAWNGEYQNVGRWKGAAIDSTPPDFIPADNDLMRLRVTQTSTGPRIQCFWNDILKIDVTDTDPALMIQHGNPGIGFFIQKDGANPLPSNTNFGFKDLTIRQL